METFDYIAGHEEGLVYHSLIVGFREKNCQQRSILLLKVLSLSF